jgi:flagellar hook-associated protein FlgK
MTPVSSITSSGLRAAQLQLDSSAHNIASMNTPGFKRQAVEQQKCRCSRPGIG